MTGHGKVPDLIRFEGQAPITLGPRQTALPVIDVQRHFVSPARPFALAFEKYLMSRRAWTRPCCPTYGAGR